MRLNLVNYLLIMIAVSLAIIALILLMQGCTRIVNFDPALLDTDCEQAHERLFVLGCYDILIIPGPDEIPLTEDDPSWTDYCQAVNNSGIVSIDTTCIVNADSCKKVEACFD